MSMTEFNFSLPSKGGGRLRLSRVDEGAPGEAIVTLEGGISSAVVVLHDLALAVRAADEMSLDSRDARSRPIYDKPRYQQQQHRRYDGGGERHYDGGGRAPARDRHAADSRD